MDWLTDTLFAPTAVQAVIVICLICALGLALGNIRFRGVSLGVTYVFFIGILAGALGLQVDSQMLSYAESFGLILFVYTLGLQVGPGFVSAFRQGGTQLNLLAVGVVLIGNSEVYSRLQGRQQAQFAQLFSRIRMQREYTTRKVKEDDVRKLFPVLAEQDARKEMDFLLSVCRSPWGIRGAMNLYTNAASANDISYENLYRMAAHMGIGMLGAV